MASIRDLTCIHSVAHMAEYGKYEEEFIVYGCSSLEQGKLVYRISPEYEEMERFVDQALLQEQYTSPIHTLMNRCVVQAGQKDGLLYKTELDLARSLQGFYPHAFFEQVNQCAAVSATDAAKELFDELRAQLNGIFSAEYLQLLEGLVHMAYQAKVLTNSALEEIQEWLQKVRKQMEYDITIKKPFQRTFYGFCYLEPDGRRRYKSNAQHFTVLEEQRKMKRKGYSVTPIFHKTYWYDYNVEPKTIRKEFQNTLEIYFDDRYWKCWEHIRGLSAIVSQQQFSESLQQIHACCGQEAEDAFLEYGYDWNVYPLR